MRWWTCVLLASLSALCPGGEDRPQPHRSPVDLAVLPGGGQALTANSTADSVSLIDLKEGRVLAELKAGRKPAGVACSRDGKRAAVSNLWSASVTLLEIDGAAVRAVAEVRVGAFPRGLAFAPDGNTIYASVSGEDEVAEIDWITRQVRHRFEAAREPRPLALSPDGRWLVAASSRSALIRCWDTQTRKLHWERRIFDAFNMQGLAFTPDGKEVVCTHAINRERPITLNHISEGWVIDNRISRLPLPADAQTGVWEIGLDLRFDACADPHGVAFTPDGQSVLVTASGSRELLILPAAHIPWSPGEPGDFLDVQLEIGKHKMRRVPLDGRPLAVAAHPDGAVVANALLDAVQVIDLKSDKVVRTIALGGPAVRSEARKGEMLFYDAKRSHHQWFSCHTCHTDGHTSAQVFDTLNDQTYGNPKLTPTLHNVARTAPYTWHGWQDTLEDAIEKSFTETMFGPKPTAAEVRAVAAFLATLEHPPHPRRPADGSLTPAAERGWVVFHEKARCVRCHQGNNFCSQTNYDVKLGDDGSPFEHWNPPSLLGLYDRGPFLHDGRARTLDELLLRHHAPEKLGGQPLTDQERKDLIAFLKSL